jgi:uncharacterized surface protein with fasciclin (FAS1) repeats
MVDRIIMPPATATAVDDSIVDIVLNNPNFSILVEALTAADLVDTLADISTQFTVFAPTNEAFAKIDSNALAQLLADKAALRALLLTHVIANTALTSVDGFASNGKMLTTAAGTDVAVSIDMLSGKLVVGYAEVSTADIYSSNGIIHVIDSVIVN